MSWHGWAADRAALRVGTIIVVYVLAIMTDVDGFCVRRVCPSWTWWYRSLDMGMAVAYGAEEASQCHHLERTDSAQRNCPSWEKTLPGAWQVPVLHGDQPM